MTPLDSSVGGAAASVGAASSAAGSVSGSGSAAGLTVSIGAHIFVTVQGWIELMRTAQAAKQDHVLTYGLSCLVSFVQPSDEISLLASGR